MNPSLAQTSLLGVARVSVGDRLFGVGATGSKCGCSRCKTLPSPQGSGVDSPPGKVVGANTAEGRDRSHVESHGDHPGTSVVLLVRPLLVPGL